MDIYIENTRILSTIAGLKLEGIVKWRDLKSQVPRTVLNNIQDVSTRPCDPDLACAACMQQQ